MSRTTRVTAAVATAFFLCFLAPALLVRVCDGQDASEMRLERPDALLTNMTMDANMTTNATYANGTADGR